MAEAYPFWDSMKEKFEDASPLILVLLVVYLYKSSKNAEEVTF
jgi:hypothetical protein